MRTILLLLILAGTSVADDHPAIERSLRQSYEKQVRLLQNFYTDSHLRYDESGNIVGVAHPGPWTLAYVQIKKVRLTTEHLELSGQRVGAEFQPGAKRVSNGGGKEEVRIEIAVPPAVEETSVRSALDSIFYAPNAIPISSMPDYWRDLLNGNAIRRPGPDGAVFRTTCPSGTSVDSPVQIDPSGARKMICSGTTIYRVMHGGVTPPKAVSTPDPSYNKIAKEAKYQGTTVLWVVVDEAGNAQLPRILQPIGMGLDDAAVDVVRRWKFKPAQLNGQPVAVQINIEVNFRLY